jgi:hypothetical protein
LEERSTQEVVNHDAAIEALKKEVELIEAEKTRLVGEAAGLRVAHARADFDNLQGKVESLGARNLRVRRLLNSWLPSVP